MLEWSAPDSEFLALESFARCSTSPANSFRLASNRCLNSANSSVVRKVFGSGFSSLNWIGSCDEAVRSADRKAEDDVAAGVGLPALAIRGDLPPPVFLAAVARAGLAVFFFGAVLAFAVFFRVAVDFLLVETTDFVLAEVLVTFLREAVTFDLRPVAAALVFVRFAT